MRNYFGAYPTVFTKQNHWRLKLQLCWKFLTYPFERNAALVHGIYVWTFPCPSFFSGNFLKRMPTCKWMWRRRATRRSGWVALMRNYCGVFRQASWALACPPAPPPFIDPCLDQAPLPAHTPTISDTFNWSSCIKHFLLSGFGSPDLFLCWMFLN